MHSLLLLFNQDQFLRLYQFCRNTAFMISNLHKDFHQDNLSFVSLQFYKLSCLNIFASSICCHIQAKNQQEWL